MLILAIFIGLFGFEAGMVLNDIIDHNIDKKDTEDTLTNYWRPFKERENFVPVWRLGDSLINFDNNHLNAFLDRLIERKKRTKSLYVKAMRFYGYARGTISYDLAKKLWDAGCIQLWVGVESFNNDLLKLYGKQLTIEKSTESILNLLKNHITVGILLMTNYPAINRIPEDHIYYNLLQGKFHRLSQQRRPFKKSSATKF